MKKIITHNGGFHSDDVFAVATLQFVFEDEELEVVRTRDFELIENGDFVVDVGGVYDPDTDRFDHHQIGGAGERKNGIQYASFGLVWRKFGVQLCKSDKVADSIDNNLVQLIDAGDNGIDIIKDTIFPGVYDYSITNFVNLFKPTWKEKNKKMDDQFSEAVSWARQLLKREIEVTSDKFEAKHKIIENYEKSEDKQLIIFDEKESYGREITTNILLNYPEPLYVILYRDDVDDWQVVAVRKGEKTFESRKLLPEKWRGLRDEKFAAETGVPDAIFCHRSGFMCIAKSKEGAIKLAKLAIIS